MPAKDGLLSVQQLRHQRVDPLCHAGNRKSLPDRSAVHGEVGAFLQRHLSRKSDRSLGRRCEMSVQSVGAVEIGNPELVAGSLIFPPARTACPGHCLR
jgi:hypothetical protein